MLSVSGIGKVKLGAYGQVFLEAIQEHCQTASIDMDVQWNKAALNSGPPKATRPSGTKATTYPMLREGRSFEEIAQKAEITVGTVVSHVLDLMQEEALPSIDCWLSTELQQRIVSAADIVGRERLKPIFEHLGQSVSYEQIRLMLTFERQQLHHVD